MLTGLALTERSAAAGPSNAPASLSVVGLWCFFESQNIPATLLAGLECLFVEARSTAAPVTLCSPLGAQFVALGELNTRVVTLLHLLLFWWSQ